MKNKLLIDTLILASALLIILLFFNNSFSTSKPDSLVSIPVNSINLEFNKDQVESDLNTLSSVSSAEISVDVGVIEIEIDNDAFNANSVKQILDKWGCVYENDWDIEVIASSEF
jgi:hypothetical protein